MARRFKQFHPDFAPKNHEATREKAEGRITPRGDYIVLTDEKAKQVSARINSKLVAGQVTEDEALYLRDYALRMRRDWGPWFDSTSVNYILVGGLEEIRALQRRDNFVSSVIKLKEKDDDTAA